MQVVVKLNDFSAAMRNSAHAAMIERLLKGEK